MNISIKTFELTFKMKIKKFNEFLRQVKDYNADKDYIAYSSSPDYEYDHKICFDRYSFTCFKSIGIPQWIFTKVMNLNEIPLCCTCKLLIDIDSLMENIKNSYVFRNHTIKLDTIPEVLQYYVDDLFPGFKYVLKSRKLTKVNYYTSIKFRSKEDSDDYYKLLEKYNDPPHLAIWAPACDDYDEIGPKISSNPDGITVKCNSYELRIYPVQVPKKEIPFSFIKDYYTIDEINAAEGELRIELS